MFTVGRRSEAIKRFGWKVGSQAKTGAAGR